jgi:hypothetical protein
MQQWASGEAPVYSRIALVRFGPSGCDLLPDSLAPLSSRHLAIQRRKPPQLAAYRIQE